MQYKKILLALFPLWIWFSVAHTAEENMKRGHLCSASQTTVRPQVTGHLTQDSKLIQFSYTFHIQAFIQEQQQNVSYISGWAVITSCENSPATNLVLKE